MGMTGKISRFLAIAGVVLGIAPALAQAQGTTISGQVTGTGGEPVAGASVSIPTLRVGAFTDEAGKYSFTVPATVNGTTVTLLARRLGYTPSSASVTVTGAPVTQNFSLSTAATELQPHKREESSWNGSAAAQQQRNQSDQGAERSRATRRQDLGCHDHWCKHARRISQHHHPWCELDHRE